jgi:chaperonin GroES
VLIGFPRVPRLFAAPQNNSKWRGEIVAVASAPKPKTSTKLKPLGSRVVIKALDREEITKSGIVLPDTAKEKPQEGRVLAVGPGDRHPDTGQRIPVELKVGDRVLFQKYAGTEFKLDDEELLILSEKDVLGTVEV